MNSFVNTDSCESLKIQFRDYAVGDAEALTELFYAAVESLSGKGYSEEEIRAWAPLPIPYGAWRERLVANRIWVVDEGDRQVGFIALKPGGHIDLLFIHPDFHRRGLATKLYNILEREARNAGMESLTVDASLASKPLFARLGFRLVREQPVTRNSCTLACWRMQKRI